MFCYVCFLLLGPYTFVQGQIFSKGQHYFWPWDDKILYQVDTGYSIRWVCHCLFHWPFANTFLNKTWLNRLCTTSPPKNLVKLGYPLILKTHLLSPGGQNQITCTASVLFSVVGHESGHVFFSLVLFSFFWGKIHKYMSCFVSAPVPLSVAGCPRQDSLQVVSDTDKLNIMCSVDAASGSLFSLCNWVDNVPRFPLFCTSIYSTWAAQCL